MILIDSINSNFYIRKTFRLAIFAAYFENSNRFIDYNKRMKDFFEELKWRGMIHDTMPGAEEQLKNKLGFLGSAFLCETRHFYWE